MGITNACAVVSCVLGRCQSTCISIFNGLPKRAQRTLQLMKFKLPAEPPVELRGRQWGRRKVCCGGQFFMLIKGCSLRPPADEEEKGAYHNFYAVM